MTNLPAQYQWLTKLPDLPNTIRFGLQDLGVQEVVGKGSNKTIIAWRDELNSHGVKIVGYSDDDIAWCGLFAAIVAFRRMRTGQEVPASPLWARNWTRYGVPASKPSLGDVLVFSRGNGGHVGFYVAEDKTCFHVLGGNQSNRVSIARIEKSRLLAARRPRYNVQPASVKPYHVNATGAVSKNEA